jgi:hypothetical protein
MDFPLTDVAAAGGWKDVGTPLECYQHADSETLLTVMEGRAHRHDSGADPEERQPLG